MKKIILFIVFLSCCSFPQITPRSDILMLQNSLKQINITKDFNNINFNSVAVTKKSTGLAILYSFLLPGMGELYAGSYSSGKYFTIAEGTLWGIYIGMNSYSYWLRNNYKAFAASAAGVNNANKNSNYYATIADYTNISEYNDAMSLQDNFSQMLDPKTYYWNWQSTADRKNYRTLWVSSQEEINNLRFVVGALILNRVVSAINAARLVAAYNKSQTTDLSWNFSIGVNNPETLPSSLLLNFQTEF
jgi:TM2 domain-containing membrane protein YozV